MNRSGYFTLVAAVGKNNELSLNGDLIWKFAKDLRNFKKYTLGQNIIMGRKTYESIGFPLPGRRTIVVTSQKGYPLPGDTDKTSSVSVESIEKAIELCGLMGGVVVGGAEICKAFMALSDDPNFAIDLYLTEIEAEAEADTFFPPVLSSKWFVVKKQDEVDDETGIKFSFVNYLSRK